MEHRLVLNNRTDTDITNNEMCGIFHQRLKYSRFRRVPTKTGKVVFYLFFHKEEDTYAALRAAKAIKEISLVRYRPMNPVECELPFRPFPPNHIINTCRYAFRKYLDRFDTVMNEPILITIPMPTIILQIPLGRIIQSREADFELNNGSNTRCTHCSYSENEKQELNGYDMESKELDVDDIKIVEIKEEAIFPPDIDEQNRFNEYMFDNHENLYKASLSSISQADIKDEIYDWNHLFADKLRKKYTDTNGIVFYSADFGLLDYEWYGHTIGSERILNEHEKKLFKVNTYFNKNQDRNCCLDMTFVRTMEEFNQNLATRFSSNTWIGAIDFSKWAIIGGCVLNALCQSPFPDTKQQDINLVYYVNDILDFKRSIDDTVNNLYTIVSQKLHNEIKMERIPGTPDYNVFLPGHIRLNFTWTSLGNSKNPLSHILHNLDMDICQVGFTGDRIVSTFPFLQALATKSLIVYSLHARSPKHLCTRIAKYCNRGFKLLQPIDFDGDFDLLMAQEEVPLYRIEYHHYIDDDGEIQLATKEYRRGFLHNIDTFRLQERFMHMVCPQLLQYT
ncbi:unnamed protein product [Adineta steineri]|uniref:Uncharacterized protein n=2 Tax=Adineta steineri TaxID=433720 RepID=A0A819TPL1_9BILA|nr:unnamed protein product [Adineta steineri]